MNNTNTYRTPSHTHISSFQILHIKCSKFGIYQTFLYNNIRCSSITYLAIKYGDFQHSIMVISKIQIWKYQAIRIQKHQMFKRERKIKHIQHGQHGLPFEIPLEHS